MLKYREPLNSVSKEEKKYLCKFTENKQLHSHVPSGIYQELSCHHLITTFLAQPVRTVFGSLWVKSCPRLQLFCPTHSELQPHSSGRSWPLAFPQWRPYLLFHVIPLAQKGHRHQALGFVEMAKILCRCRSLLEGFCFPSKTRQVQPISMSCFTVSSPENFASTGEPNSWHPP